jgi:hypothetical protein
MKPEQRVLIKYLLFKKLKLFDIHYKFVFTFGEEAYILASVRDSIHELKI